MAEDFPENKYDFKPTPSVQSFAQRLIHAGAANHFFTNLALGRKPPAEEDPKRDRKRHLIRWPSTPAPQRRERHSMCESAA
jgi:hypothetical protein